MRALIALLGLLAIGVHYLAGISLGLLWLGLFVGWPLIGTLITLDDDAPGGWSNPNGSVSSPYRDPQLGAQLSFGVAIAALGFAHDAHWQLAATLKLGVIVVGACALGGLAWRASRRRRDDAPQ
jgi:hypothetical protein